MLCLFVLLQLLDILVSLYPFISVLLGRERLTYIVPPPASSRKARKAAGGAQGRPEMQFARNFYTLKGDRERQRETERDRERQIETERDRERQGKTERDRERHRERVGRERDEEAAAVAVGLHLLHLMLLFLLVSLAL